MEQKNEIRENVARIRETMAEAARSCGRDPQEIKLCAATKMNDAARVKEAVAAGVDCCGENRVQELVEKQPQGAYEGVPVHFIGHLQTNKVKALLSMKDIALIQSVDSVKLATEIDKYSEKLGRTTEILLQVNIGDEEQKFGVEPADTVALVRDVSDFEHIKVKGLMATMPIEKDIRYYKEFKELFEKVKACNISGVDMDILSMGMSNDFEEAVECGSNMVRIGTALFK